MGKEAVFRVGPEPQMKLAVASASAPRGMSEHPEETPLLLMCAPTIRFYLSSKTFPTVFVGLHLSRENLEVCVKV